MRQSQEKAVSQETANADSNALVPSHENKKSPTTDISENEESSTAEPSKPHRTRWTVMAALVMALVAIVGVFRNRAR
jgi:hypothetical protein